MLIWISEPDCGCESPAERRWWGAACQLTVTSAQPTQLTCSSSKPDFTCASQGILWLHLPFVMASIARETSGAIKRKCNGSLAAEFPYCVCGPDRQTRQQAAAAIYCGSRFLCIALCLTLCYTHCASATYILCVSCSLCKTW